MTESTMIALTHGLVAIVLSGTGFVMLWLASRSATDRLPRNQFAGIRTALTMSSDAAWFAAQRAGASATRVAGIGVIVGAVLCGITGFIGPGESALAVTALATAAWLLVWAFVGSARGQRAARAVSPNF